MVALPAGASGPAGAGGAVVAAAAGGLAVITAEGGTMGRDNS